MTTKVLILAGGKGTRLQQLAGAKPKPMIEVEAKPFLFWLIQKLNQQSPPAPAFTEFILSVGHQAQVIEEYNWQQFFAHCKISFSKELHPLGTGGAVCQVFAADQQIKDLWVVNGDTYLTAPIHLSKASMAQTNWRACYLALEQNQVFDASPNLVVAGQQVVGYQATGGQFFDAGAVYLQRSAFDLDFFLKKLAQNQMISLHELLNDAMQKQQVGYQVIGGDCYDIGTPERYQRFVDFIKNRGQ